VKFSSAEEYGMRCLMNFADVFGSGKTLTIPEISKKEKIPEHTVAKILRELRIGGFLVSERGHTGGYSLSRAPEEILIGDVLHSLGGKLYEVDMCSKFAGYNETCIHNKNCKIRSLWEILQKALDSALAGITLKDLAGNSIKPKGEIEIDL
jgi:Rrf2 family protein